MRWFPFSVSLKSSAYKLYKAYTLQNHRSDTQWRVNRDYVEEPSIPGTSITSVKKRKAKGSEGRKGIDAEAIGYGCLDSLQGQFMEAG